MPFYVGRRVGHHTRRRRTSPPSIPLCGILGGKEWPRPLDHNYWGPVVVIRCENWE